MTEPPTTTDIGEFARRHIGPADADLAEMLGVVGAASMEDLIDRAVPAVIRGNQDHDLPGPLTETESLDRLAELADRNEVFTSMIGMGYSGTILPSVIRRNLLGEPRLVQRIHPVSAGDLAGPARGIAQLPDDGY